jgi:hypothetical protein
MSSSVIRMNIVAGGEAYAVISFISSGDKLTPEFFDIVAHGCDTSTIGVFKSALLFRYEQPPEHFGEGGAKFGAAPLLDVSIVQHVTRVERDVCHRPWLKTLSRYAAYWSIAPRARLKTEAR